MKRLAVLFFVASALRADVVLPDLFSDRAVLQASAKTPVWGSASPGETVRVTLGAVSASARADDSGRWRVDLDLTKVGPGPFELVAEGRNRTVATDVLVGQVWLCSGQSNMEWPLRSTTGGADEAARAGNPSLRHFKCANVASPVPLRDAKGMWSVSSPRSAPDFSATAYYFGSRIQRELGAPVGLINASWGGTPVEAWIRPDAFDADADLKAGAQKAREDAVAFKNYLRDYRAWIASQKREDRSFDAAAFITVGADAANWTRVTLPGALSAAGLPDAGTVWIVKKITLPESAVGSALRVFLGDARDSVRLYWNGAPCGEGGPEKTLHDYSIGAKHVTSREGVLAVRIHAPAGGAGIAAGAERFRIDFKGGNQPLAGEWLARAEYGFSGVPTAVAPVRPSRPRGDNNVAGYLFDGMIRPLIPTALAGVIWYQGEHNWDRGWQYRTAFRLMIQDWRAQWGGGDLPFYFCQLPNYGASSAKPGFSNWAEVRESQAAALALPATGMAVLIDVGEAGNIHPGDKRSVGERLALQALAGVYGRPVVANGPVYASHTIEGGRARIVFSNADHGLATKPAGSAVKGFSVCGADRRWEWAEARIEGDSVVVWSPAVSTPVAVRYAWADNPECTLFNGAGLPAAPFRTDDYPASSFNRKY